MEYADFPYPKLGASYITQQQVLEYINGYAQHFNLHRHIKFNVRVKKVRPIEKDKWKVTVVDVKTKSEETSCYDAVMVCNGHYSDPFVPDLKGSEEFEGKQWHSHDYREPSSLKGKRVLLLGAGPSGADIGAQIATVAKKVGLTSKFARTPQKQALQVFLSHGTKLKTPLPEGIAQKPYVVALTKNGAVFQDSTEETVGEILYCTGYKYTFPFLTPECGIEASSCKVQPLYKQVININRPTMCVIGIPFRVCPFPMFDVQVGRIFGGLRSCIVISGELLSGDFDRAFRVAIEGGDAGRLEEGGRGEGGGRAEGKAFSSRRVEPGEVLQRFG